MKLTGQKLQEKREAARLTISEVSLATKINPKVLMAMEAGDLANLPATTFLRGFVRSYAGFLKMNVHEVLTVFNQEIGEAEKEKKEIAHTTVEKQPERATSAELNGEGNGTFRAFLVGAILVLIVLIIGVRSLIQKYERERSVESTAEVYSPLDGKSATPVPGATPTPVPSVTPSPTSSMTPEAATVVAPIPMPVASANPSPTPSSAPSPAPSKEPIMMPPSPPVSPNPLPIAAPPAVTMKPTPPVAPDKPADIATKVEKSDDKGKGKKGQKHEIMLEALDNVQVSFKLHGKTEKLSLAPNQIHTIHADESITLDVSDGGALNIIDNGRDKGPPGDLGHSKQVTIP